MSELFRVWPWLLAMGLLILVSAFFSGSEAAMFSLNVRDRRRLARHGKAGQAVATLLRDPEQLLSAILFWNLVVNMAYFGIASIVAAGLESSEDLAGSATLAFTAASLLTIIFFSEMLPKSIAVLSPERFSIGVAPVLNGAVRIVSPILPLLKFVNLAASRLVWPSLRPEPEIELSDIERAIELGTDDAALAGRERETLQAVVGLAEARAVEVMRPRSRLKIVPPTVDESVLAEPPPPGGFLMIADPDTDLITAAIGLRSLRPSQVDSLRSATEPVIYVPWSARVAQVLDGLTEEARSVAVVVNEFGEAIGAISVDDILRDVLAPDRPGDPEEAIRSLDQDRYRLPGSISLRALAKQLGVEVPEEPSATVAGHLQRQNERRPRLGDTGRLGPFELTVVEESDLAVWIEAHPAAPDISASEDES